MADPLEYANATYLNLTAKLDDSSLVTVKIDRYLNAGLKLDRTLNAEKEKDGLLGAIAKELKVIGIPPLKFQIDSTTINRLELQRVFTGKGSPDAIRTVLWLASRYKRTDKEKAADYCNRNIGLDCNGFAGNYWGIDPTTEISGYDKGRRKKTEEVSSGDAMIFYKKDDPTPYHLAVVQEINVDDKQMQVIVVQSAGLEKGLEKFDWGKMTPQKTKAGDLFVHKLIPGVADTTMFFAAGPDKGKSNL